MSRLDGAASRGSITVAARMRWSLAVRDRMVASRQRVSTSSSAGDARRASADTISSGRPLPLPLGLV